MIKKYTPDPNNARLHPDRNKQMIRHSLEEVGPFRSIAIDADGVRRADLRGEQAERAALFDNATSDASTWDVKMLSRLQIERPHLLAGLDEVKASLAASLAEMEPPEPGEGGDEFDPTPSEDENGETETRCQPGDLWLIDGGKHRLLIGDSTDQATINRLMGGDVLRLIVTDPPYGVSYADKNRYLNAISRGNRIQVPIENDHGDIQETAQHLWKPAFKTMHTVADRGCVIYCFMPQGGDQMMMMMMMMMEFPPKHELIWLKNNHVLGRSDYNYKHEPIVYAWKDSGHKFYGDFQTSILSFNKPQKSDLHPTMKPIDLIQHLITNSSLPGEIVGDWFLGSGTTLIAAHRTNRRCFGCELTPTYGTVILNRCEAEGMTVELDERLT